MQCTFKEEKKNPDGTFSRTECINSADIRLIHDPCCGLCYTCAYKQTKAEMEKHRWISVGEGNPKEVGCYLLHFCDGLIITGHWNSEKWQVYATASPRYHYPDNITHWKPIILPNEQ